MSSGPIEIDHLSVDHISQSLQVVVGAFEEIYAAVSRVQLQIIYDSLMTVWKTPK